MKKERVPEIKDALLEIKDVSALETTNPYEAFRMKYGDEVIVGYTSGKVVTTGRLSADALSRAIMRSPSEDTSQTVIGSDEAGKGEWLGPLVVAAIAISPDQRKTFISKGVMDSKLLSLGTIAELSKFIKGATRRFKIVTLAPARFNELMIDVKDEGKSLNDILAWAHSLAIKNVTEQLPPSTPGKVRIVIDEFDKLKTERRLARVIDRADFDVIQHPRAEEEVAVAAASILARDEREHWLDRRSQVLKQDLRKLNLADALENPLAYSFAKITYLKQGNSPSELLTAKFLQNVLALEYSLQNLVGKIEGNQAQEPNALNMQLSLNVIQRHGFITERLMNEMNLVIETRNNLMHAQQVPRNDLERAVKVSDEISRYFRNLIEQSKPVNRKLGDEHRDDGRR